MLAIVLVPLTLWAFLTQEPWFAVGLGAEAVAVGSVLWRLNRDGERATNRRRLIVIVAITTLACMGALSAWYLIDYRPVADEWGLVLLGVLGSVFIIPALAVIAAIPAAIIGGLAWILVRHRGFEDAMHRNLPRRLAFVAFGALLAPLLAFGMMFGIGMALTG